MTKAEALALVEELWEMVGDYPHENKEAIQRAKRIEFLFNTDPRATGYVREKAGEVTNMFGYWFTQRRWRQYGDDPSHLKAIVHNDVYKLRGAIQSHYPDDGSDL